MAAGLEAFKASWGIEILDKGVAELEAGAESLSQRHVEEYLLDTDIRKFGLAPLFPKELPRLKEVPPGKYFVQVSKIADITQPSKFQEDFEGGKWRLLALDLTDGSQKFRGIEYGSIKDLGVHLPPGTKLLLTSTQSAPLRVANGHLLLEQRCVKVLWGNVDKLVENWKASKEVEEKRLLWRTEGVKKSDGEGAPPWVDFDPKKARGGGRKALEEDYAEWRKPGAALGSTIVRKDEAREGTRFKVEDFAGEGGGTAPALARGQVACGAFAQAEGKSRKGGGKGKDGKDGGGGGGKGARRGRGEDWDGGEEKRAPQAVNTLAAFIKPAKGGELPDEMVAALAEPEPASSGGWDASWSGGGWDSSGWGSGWQGGGWSGGGGGGGGKGHRKGGGGKGGGGKGGGGKGGGKGGKRSGGGYW